MTTKTKTVPAETSVAAANEPETLDDLVAQLETFQPRTGSVDVSDMFKDEDGKTLPAGSKVFVYEDPTVEHFFAASKDGEILRKKYPHWTSEQCTNVALLALCHKAPAAKAARGQLYAHIAAKNTALFMRLNDGFDKAFPHLRDIRKEADDRLKRLTSV